MIIKPLLYICSFLISLTYVYAIDSTSLGPQIVTPMCCQTVPDMANKRFVDCYSGSTWICPWENQWPAGGDYSGILMCNQGEIFAGLATYSKYNYTHATWQMMVRGVWCAPPKTECKPGPCQ